MAPAHRKDHGRNRRPFHHTAARRHGRRNPLIRSLRLEPLESRWVLAALTVGNLNDVVNGDVTSVASLNANPGPDGISLREAIAAANVDFLPDTISFSVTGVIQLTNVGHAGELKITNDLTINGPGANLLTIKAFDPDAAGTNNGNGARIFNIDDGISILPRVVAINKVTLTNGDVAGMGGAIFAAEGLDLAEVVITDNATAIGAGFHGGAIFSNDATLRITNSTISNNRAGDSGGAIYKTGGNTAQLTGSTLSGNVARMSGGAIAHVSASALLLVNSTISGNVAELEAGGGVFNSNGDVTVKHSTITANTAPNGKGSGVASVGNATTRTNVTSSIIAANSSNDDVALVTMTTTNSFVSQNYNFTGGGSGNIAFTGSGDRRGVFNPLLGPLANNGGSTLTHALVFGSLAINGGDPAAVAGAGDIPLTDQRGGTFGRRYGGRIDIGAFEFQSAVAAQSLVVSSTADEIDGNYGPSNLSLREALKLANDNLGVVDSIAFAVPAGSIIKLTHGELRILDGVSVIGPGADRLIIDASGNDPTPLFDNGDGSRVFKVDDANAATMAKVTISGMTLTGGDAADIGGAVLSFEDLTLTDSAVIGNHSATNGGGIADFGGKLALNATSVLANRATGETGGGVFSSTGALSVNWSTISGNFARLEGGGINAQLGSPSVSYSTIANNVSNEFGGGIATSGGIFVVASTISGNSARTHGGALSFFGTATLENSTLSGNVTRFFGSGVANFGYLQVLNCTIIGNRTIDVTTFPDDGGGIYTRVDLGPGNPAGVTKLVNSIVADNLRVTTPSDLTGAPVSAQSRFNIIGDAATAGGLANGVNGNIVGMPVQFVVNRTLTDNGGPTLTLALTPGHVAIDAGDPEALPGANGYPQFDQRGPNYTRVYNASGLPHGRIDIGAFEYQPPPSPSPSADFNSSGRVDGFDFLAWQRGFGATGGAANRANGDSDHDADVDAVDLAFWRSSFGNPALEAAAAPAQAHAMVTDDVASPLTPQALDAALAYQQLLSAPTTRPLFRPRAQRAR